VIVYHISGCGVCNDCRRGYMISCTSEKYRRLRMAARRRYGRVHGGRGKGPHRVTR
jgi:D-arabinose 1-dehydrogenase-like Zn-dependent alcohol dehydrogenase